MREQLLTTTAAAAAPEDPAASPTLPDLANLPVYVDRKTGAALVSRYLFRVSHRTLERWPLTGRTVNGRKQRPTVELFEYARALVDAAPPIRGGKRSAEIDTAA